MKNTLGVLSPTSPAMLSVLLVAGLQCFSTAIAEFTDPVDASTLREAMITGSSAEDDAQYWECSVADGSVVLEYRLLGDGTGLENDRATPNRVSTFTWNTRSSSAAVSNVDATGAQNDLSSISFKGSDSMSLLVAGRVPLACERRGQGAGSSALPAEDNAVSSSNEQRAGSTGSAVVSVENRPVASYTRLKSRFVGFPAKLVYTAEVAYSFPNGYTVYCANWDPRYLDPTPGSVGQAIEGCEVKKGKPEGSLNKGFTPGQTIEINFGNISASGNDMGGSTSSRISGSTLLMSRSGRIIIGKFNTFSVASGGNGAGGGNKKRELVGTYELDGHLITITTTTGEVLTGFISWESDSESSQIGHIYINGEHFWNRKK